MLNVREIKVSCVEISNVQNDSTRLESLFHEARSKTSPQERAAYLDEVCRESPKLRDEIESLLAAHDKADGFLLLPETDASAMSLPASSSKDS
jgi:hypothetical protein